MEDVTKKYICKLPTDGYEVGAEVMLTEAQVANFNGGEAEPRFVFAEDQTVAPAAEEKKEEEAPQAGIDGNASAPSAAQQ